MSNEVILSSVELKRFEACEKIIEVNRKGFIDFANALIEIRDGRYYREQYSSFEKYCQDKWGFTRQHVNRTIAAGEVAQKWNLIGSKITETAVRPITKIPPRNQKAVVKDAEKSAKENNELVAAKHIKQAVAKFESKKAEANGGPVDAIGRVIPVVLRPIWDRREEIQKHLNAITAIKLDLNKADRENDPLYASIHFQTFFTRMDACYHDLKYSIPYAVCGLCNGVKCKVCKTGLMNKLSWDQNVPEETKEMIARAVKR